MKKEEKSTPISAKARSIYKYELQATNQILKDTLDIYPSSLHSTTPPHTHYTPPTQYYQTCLNHQNHYHPYTSHKQHANSPQKNLSSLIFEEQHKLNSTQNQFQMEQHIKYHHSNQPYYKSKTQVKRKTIPNDVESHYNSQIYSFSSENEDHFHKGVSLFPNQSASSSNKKEKVEDNKKELRRQRRGLAHISLKVKNIVAKKGRMTFKEVSDQVLKESQEDLPNDHAQREKQTKNIRRRVYDALNVLVSVGILGKDNRFVIHTQQTSVPGKKLSSHWQLINQKKRLVEQQQKNYENKRLNLMKLQKNYQHVLLLHQRNKSYLQTIDKKSLNSPHHKYHLTIQPFYDRLYFPLIFIIPPKKHINKIKVQIEYQDRHDESIKKFIIEGTENVLTDVDCMKHIRYNHLSEQQLATISKQLKPLLQREKQIEFIPRMNPFISEDDIYLDD